MYGSSTIPRAYDGEIGSLAVCSAFDRYVSGKSLPGKISSASDRMQKGGGIKWKM